MDLLVAAPSLQVDALRLQVSVSTVPLRSSLRTWCRPTDAEAGLRTMTLKAPGHHLFYKCSRRLAGAKLNTAAALGGAKPRRAPGDEGSEEDVLLFALCLLSGIHSLLRVGCIACKDRVCYHYVTGTKESRKGLLYDRGSLKCV